MKPKSFLLLSFLILSQISFAQKETNWWYFGANAGISFTGSGGSPAAQTNGKINSGDGVASISNSKGDLLFYTDGATVYNKQHAVMNNGTGLKGDVNSTQSCIIVQQPVRSNRYWIFTADAEWGNDGFQCSIVDTAASSGLGQIISKNNHLLTKATTNTYTAEKISATMHANKVDTWVATHSGDDNKFYVYKLNALGLSSPVVSSVGPTWARSGTNARGYAKGYLKFSPDGTKLVAAIAGEQNSSGEYLNNAGRIEIYDFDNLTGVVSNPQIIDKSNIKSGVGNISAVYGIEFSPNGRFLYTSFYMPFYIVSGSDGNDGLWQLDLSSNNANTIGASCIKVVSSFSTNSGGAMQLGPDGKIYLARGRISGGAGYLSCIEKPNCKGSGCSFVDNAVSLSGKTGTWGLPNFNTSFLNKSIFDWGSSPSNLCENSLTKFYVLDSSGIDSAIWNFGDASTGTKNKAIGFTAYHKFSATKTFSVFLSLYRKSPSTVCIADTGRKSVTIFAYPKPNLGRDTGVCQGEVVVLNDNTANASWMWNGGPTVPNYSADTKGWHWVDVKVGGCTMRDSMYLDVIQYPKFSFGKDTAFCDSDSIKLSGSGGQNYLWNNGKTTSSIIVKDTGKVWVKANNGKCFTYDTILLKKTIVKANFTIDNPGHCLKNNVFNFKETSIYKSNPRKQSTYYFEDASTVKDSLAKKSFPNEGTYTVKLIAQSKLGCKDSISKTVNVFPQTKVEFSIKDSIQCLNGNSFNFTNKTTDTGKISYGWDFGDKTFGNTKDIEGKVYTKEGSYKVKIVSITSNNCIDSIIHSVKVLLSPKADFTADDICEYDSALFINKSTNATGYNWKFGDGQSSTIKSPKHFYDPKTIDLGNVTLVVNNTNGCADSITKSITINSMPRSTFIYTQITGSTIYLKADQSGNTYYRWLFDGKDSITGNQTPNHSFNNGMMICLKVINAAGCVSETCDEIKVGAIPKSESFGFKIFPNPNTGNFAIEFKNPEKDISIEVYNSLGELVEKVEIVENVIQINLDVASGIYLVKVRNGGIVYNKKVSISK